MRKSVASMILLTLAFTYASLATAREGKTTLTGYLMDRMCSSRVLSAADWKAAAKKHTKECATECAESGYGIVSDGKYYGFDAQGNKLADVLLKQTKKTAGISIEVTGTLQGETFNVDSLKETE